MRYFLILYTLQFIQGIALFAQGTITVNGSIKLVASIGKTIHSIKDAEFEIRILNNSAYNISIPEDYVFGIEGKSAFTDINYLLFYCGKKDTLDVYANILSTQVERDFIRAEEISLRPGSSYIVHTGIMAPVAPSMKKGVYRIRFVMNGNVIKGVEERVWSDWVYFSLK